MRYNIILAGLALAANFAAAAPVMAQTADLNYAVQTSTTAASAPNLSLEQRSTMAGRAFDGNSN